MKGKYTSAYVCSLEIAVVVEVAGGVGYCSVDALSRHRKNKEYN